MNLYFWSLDYPSADLIYYHKAVDLAKPVLKALSNLDAFISDDITVEDYFASLKDENDDDFFIKKRVKQKQRKKTSRSLKAPAIIDPRPFEILGIPVPTFRQDAQRRAEEILADQKAILLVRSFLPNLLPL